MPSLLLEKISQQVVQKFQVNRMLSFYFKFLNYFYQVSIFIEIFICISIWSVQNSEYKIFKNDFPPRFAKGLDSRQSWKVQSQQLWALFFWYYFIQKYSSVQKRIWIEFGRCAFPMGSCHLASRIVKTR